MSFVTRKFDTIRNLRLENTRLAMPARVAQADPEILKALGLDAARTKMARHGSSAFSSTFKISSTAEDGTEQHFFVKQESGPDAEVKFRGEHASLKAIHSVVPYFCAVPQAHGALSTPNHFFLATEFLDLGASPPSGLAPTLSGPSLAAKLAKLHTTPAPTPAGFDRPMFGFPTPTWCGGTEQPNTWTASWADFFAEHRLRAIMRQAERARAPDAKVVELAAAVNHVADAVVPRLLGEDGLEPPPRPVLVHGDLWCGNHGRRAGGEAVVYDPSCVFGHSEYELGIMRLFGGFRDDFWREYEKLVPRAEPKKEWSDRMKLYELYHQLNHYVLYGDSYWKDAITCSKKLICRYG